MASDDLSDATAGVSLSQPQLVGRGFYRYERYDIVSDEATVERDLVRVGGVVVIVPVDLSRDEVVLIRQFRLGGHVALDKGDMVELPAGRVEPGEDWLSAAQRECQEETGLAPGKTVPIFRVMPSPGMSDELMSFYLMAVDSSKTPARAGAPDEHEYTRPIRVSIGRAVSAVMAGRLHYGAAVFGLQWLALNRSRLSDILRNGAVA
jgi:ADP-ribose pyrophosphatase